MFRVKQKIFLVFFSLFLLGSVCLSELNGRHYLDDKYRFEIKGPSSWDADTKRRGKQIVFLRKDGITEVSVEVMPLEADQNDSQDVAKDQNIAYDGWQYVAGRKLDWHERHGASNGFSAMYHKVMLRQVNTNTKIIVQEGYFVKNRLAYIVTLVTDTDRWQEAKSELLYAWDSFKVR